MEIAQTILEQIKTLTPTAVIWSWGASKWQAVGENQIEGVGEQYLGGLLFYVRGHHHKGHVFITLAGNDTYTVTLGNVRKGKISVKKQFKDLYFDQLSDTIDMAIERIPEYI